MKTHLSGVLALTCGILLALTASPALAKKGGNRPGGGGQDPPPNPAPVEYQLTWIPGINDGRMDIYDCNTAGIAVGRYDDEMGSPNAFWTAADGMVNPLDNWWALPTGYEGWRVIGHEMQINEANQVCGTIGNDQTSQYQLFLADLSDPDSLEAVGPIQRFRPSWIFMNEHGDVTFRELVEGNITTLHFYVRSLDKFFSWESDVLRYRPTGINDNRQVSFVSSEVVRTYYSAPIYGGSGLLSFNVATETAEFEDLSGSSGYAESFAEPLMLPWGGLNNAGTVFGCFETEVSRVRVHRNRVVSRVADTTAGFITPDSVTWTELDPRLPVGGSQESFVSYAAAACALGVNEFGQVVGGYQCKNRYSSETLWLLDPEDGLFDVDDLVVGDPTEIEAFQSAYDFGYVHITGIDSETGYGIISGAAQSHRASFLLTPRLIEQP